MVGIRIRLRIARMRTNIHGGVEPFGFVQALDSPKLDLKPRVADNRGASRPILA